MNKKVIIALVVVLLLVAGYLLMKPKSQTSSDSSKSSFFTSVKDALDKNISLFCEFKDESGKVTKSYIKNGTVRVSSTTDDQAGEIIIQKEKMYIWDEKTKAGFIYEIKKEDQTEVGVTGTQTVQSQSYLNMIEQYKDSCKVAVLEDSMFTPPTNINFQDMSSLLENLQKQIPSIPSQN